MADYILDFSDKNLNRSLTIQDAKFYGQNFPADVVKDPAAQAVSGVSLTLYGKNTPSYGEKIQENTLYLLENFAGVVEPAFAVTGQDWYDRASSVMKTYDARKHQISSSTMTASTPTSKTFSVNITGTSAEQARFTAMIAKDIRIISPDPIKDPTQSLLPAYERELFVRLVAVTSPSTNVVTLSVTVFDMTVTTLLNWFVGGWRSTMLSNELDVLNANGVITGVSMAAAPAGSDAINVTYFTTNVASIVSGALGSYYTAAAADSAFVNTTGDTMVGFLTLNADPVTALNAAPKQYVDAGDSLAVKLAGSTMSGFLTLSADPTALLHAATKNYVDTEIAAAVGGGGVALSALTDVTATLPYTLDDVLIYNGTAWVNEQISLVYATKIQPLVATDFLPKSGGTMTGDLTLVGNPTVALHAAPKQYVDSGDAGVTTNVNITSGSLSETDGQMTLNKSASTVTVTMGTTVPSLIAQVKLPLERTILVGDGATATFTLPFSYTVGSNRLAVFKDGLKSVASIKARAVIATSPATTLTSALPTGLVAASTYDVVITIDGGIPTTINILGSNAQTWGDLINEINSGITGAKAIISGTTVETITNAVGGSVAITDGTTLPLLAALTPTVSTTPTSVPETTYGYGEPGPYFGAGTSVTFAVAPTLGAIIEVLRNYDF